MPSQSASPENRRTAVPTREVTIASPVGLHARPASELVRNAKESGQTVTISRPGQKPVDARSILAVISLGVKQGETVVVDVAGDNAAQTLELLSEILTAEEQPTS